MRILCKSINTASVATLVLLLLCTRFGRLGLAADEAPRPNIVLILMDDLRWDDLGCAGHPFVKTPHIDRLARQGASFQNAFATTPLCSPSRASFLTGLYAHVHGIVDNVDRSPESHRLQTFPQGLQAAGYETAYIGKWHMGNDDTRRPGFDHWVSIKGQGTYRDPELNVNGETVKAQGYVTDVFNDRAVAFIERRREKPFCLYLAHKAVHPDLTQFNDGSVSDPGAGNFVPAERHKGMYAGEPGPRRPNCHDTLEGKPALQRRIGDLPPLGPETATSDETIRNRLRMLMSVEEGVGRVLAALEKHNQLDRTLVIFTSDHGYFYGEHGLSVERRLAYEETIRIPLLMRYPPLIAAGSKPAEMVLSIDLAPTLLELGGAAAPARLHGRSLLPLLRGTPADWRKSVLVEYFSDKVFPRMLNMGYQAVRTERHKYIHYTDLQGMDELYDLQVDPYELKNLIADPASKPELEQMQAELSRLLNQTR
ncbi:MAG: sulfatase [Planctomycetes bacterium]|nr:sulfatase [Planctomycetota bacterium]